MPKQRKKRLGPRRRAKLRRRAELEAQAATSSNNANTAIQNHGRDPLNTGVVTGPKQPPPPQVASGAEGRKGGPALAQHAPVIQEGVQNPPDAARGQPEAQNANPGGYQTPFFERPGETRSDANLARRAIRANWKPRDEVTQAVMMKASSMALEDKATLSQVIGVAKLHIDAHRHAAALEHHEDRMDYHERALQLRSRPGEYVPGAGGMTQVNVNTGGGHAQVSIFLPAVDPIDDEEPPLTLDHP